MAKYGSYLASAVPCKVILQPLKSTQVSGAFQSSTGVDVRANVSEIVGASDS